MKAQAETSFPEGAEKGQKDRCDRAVILVTTRYQEITNRQIIQERKFELQGGSTEILYLLRRLLPDHAEFKEGLKKCRLFHIYFSHGKNSYNFFGADFTDYAVVLRASNPSEVWKTGSLK